MRCPTCKKEFHAQPDSWRTYWIDDISSPNNTAIAFLVQRCPSCHEFIVMKQQGKGTLGNFEVVEIDEQYPSVTEVIYPIEDNGELIIPVEVPEEYRRDLLEAHSVLQLSPKSSAALSRRLLQKILHEKLDIKKKDLNHEIDEFIAASKAPTYLIEAVDAVRQIGNFAAHPLKNTSTGEIVGVEEGEAEWLLETLESLFDFVFVQPQRLAQKRNHLNLKLKELGKPPLKG